MRDVLDHTITIGRPWCSGCRRAQALCWCARIRTFASSVRFCILMHPKESKVAIGTGRMAHRSIDDSVLLVGERFDDDRRLGALLAEPSHWPVLLYPTPQAIDLTTASQADARAFFPADKRLLVVLVDGTWTTAKKLLRLSSRLAALPTMRFTPAAPARYDRLRREPRAECRSTIEAVHHVIDRFDALGVAPAPRDRAHDHMLTLLDAIVTEQVGFEPPEHQGAQRGVRGASHASGNEARAGHVRDEVAVEGLARAR